MTTAPRASGMYLTPGGGDDDEEEHEVVSEDGK